MPIHSPGAATATLPAHAVTTSLLVNGAVSLIVGCALLLAWRRDATQHFTRALGLAFVVHAVSAPSFLVWRLAPMPWQQSFGGVVLVLSGAAYLTLLVAGVAELANRPMARGRLLRFAVAFALAGAAALAFEPRLAQAIVSSAHLVVGGIALFWLWPLGRAERCAGLLLLLLAAVRFGYVAFGDAALPLQSSLATLFRVALGLALLYAALRRSAGESHRLRENFKRMTELSHQGVGVIRGERMLYANPALLRIYGFQRLDDAAGNWRNATMPAGDRADGRERHRRIVSGEVDRAEWEGERFRADGTPLRLRFSAWRIDWDGKPAEQVVVSDETAHHDTMRTLLHQATHDELTGLPNRSALLQRLRELSAGDAPSPFALLLLDVDRFKLFNEAHGPSLGDEVLKALAHGLATSLAGQAEVMRLGEDEFALLARSDDGAATAQRLADAVRQFVAQPLTLESRRFFLDVSIGVALYPATARDPELLLRAANAAMHEAKHVPGTSVQFAEERFERGSGSALDVEQALRAGLRNEEFSLAYQPKVSAHGGALVGFEALARWDRPGQPPVSPHAFIAAAERTGLIGTLGEAILVRACQQIADWRDEFGRTVPVAVNVSPLQLLDPGFPDLVVRTLRRFGLAPEWLSLELTESAAVTHIAQARGQIERMRAHGVEIALDDFGTGFSSLNLLRGLPLKTLKIDRTLIEPLPAADATAVVKAIGDLAKVLNLEVVAEGVETAAQAEAARSAGCQVMQGDLYARPLPPAEAAHWLLADAGERTAFDQSFSSSRSSQLT